MVRFFKEGVIIGFIIKNIDIVTAQKGIDKSFRHDN